MVTKVLLFLFVLVPLASLISDGLAKLLLWIGATVLFTLLAVVQQADRALTTGLTIGTASVIVSGFANFVPCGPNS